MDSYSIIESLGWTKWLKFPNPIKGEYLYAPFGSGVYQLRLKSGELVLFGKGKNVAYRMSSLLPPPFGAGTRKNEDKRDYVKEHIEKIEYRTLSVNIEEASEIENKLKQLKIHRFNT